TFVMDNPATPENDPTVMNLPCDPFSKANEGKEHGKERPVGNNLIVFARVNNSASSEAARQAHNANSEAITSEGRGNATECRCNSIGCCRSRRCHWFASRRPVRSWAL